MFWFLNERTIERSFHQPVSDKPRTHCSRTKVMKCVDLNSVVLSKINACVSERKVVCRLEKSGDFHAMIREKFCFTQVQGLRSFKSTLTRLHVLHHSKSLPHQIKLRAPGVELSTSKLRRGRCSNSADVLDQKTTITQYTSWCLFFHNVWINVLGFIVAWVDLALLFKKGVGREIAVLEVANNVFSNVQHSRNPVLKFCGPRTAGDLSQLEAHSASRTFSWRLRLCSLEVNATLLQLFGSRWRKLRSSHEVSPRLARQCGSQEKQQVQASRSNLQVLLNKVRTLGSKSSLKRQTQGRLEGDR